MVGGIACLSSVDGNFQALVYPGHWLCGYKTPETSNSKRYSNIYL